MNRSDVQPKISAWQERLLLCVSGLLVFETLTGLSMYLLPFSVPNQVAVLLHTLIGLVFVVPYAWYQFRHWRLYRERQMTHIKLTGYFSMVAAIALAVSGVVLSVQALVASKISRGWDLVHVVATFALIASVLPHVLMLVYYALRGRAEGARELRLAQRRLGMRTLYMTVTLGALVALGAVAYRPTRLVNRLPDDYSFLYGPNRPFAPSLASTASGGAYDARSLAGSAGCGTGGCHERIYHEWEVSAHRYSAMDAGFQKVQSVMGEQNGPESTRYCGGCHDPISLFSGTKNIFVENLTGLHGYKEGVSCLACHAIQKTDIQGNANYTVRQPREY
ncbi:MAG TPA: cytochrome b/b6 domain-containing protein, partial [Gemmatimonadales bacterium]|nr:cytochrome b/b6 domain-containing protein [Gemmatimonadales bacterium]